MAIYPDRAPATLALRNIGLIAAPILAIVAYLLLPKSSLDIATSEPIEFTSAGRATVALMVWMATWWMTEAVEVSVTAMLPLVVMPLAGIADMPEAAAPYASDVIFLFMGGFILAFSMQRWGLDRRIALLTLRIVGTQPQMMVGGFMIATAVISAFVSNTATAAMMLPIGLSVVDLLLRQDSASGHQVQSRSTDSAAVSGFALCLMLGIAYAASIGGLATIIGTPPNAFLVGFVRDSIDPAFRFEISFLDWLRIGVPLVVVLLPICWFTLVFVAYPVRLKRIEGGRDFISRASAQLGPLNRGEWVTVVVFTVTALAWVTRPFIAGMTVGNVQPLRGLSDAGIAMIGAMALFLIPVNRGRREFAMDWNTASKLPWGVLILFGGGLSLAAAIEANGVDSFLGNIAGGLGHWPPLLVIIVVTAAVIFFSELASNTATAATLVPVLAAIAPSLDLHPLMLIIPATLAASCAFMLPAGTPPNAIVFASGYVTIPQMCKAGLWLNFISMLVITAIAFLIVGTLIRA